MPDIRDIKPPVDLPSDFLPLFLLAAFCLLCGPVFYLIRFFLGRRPSKILVSQPPWQTALERLADLKKNNLPQEGKIKEFYTQLSDILRQYVEGRFQIKATEMTTPEFLWQLKVAHDLNESQKSLLGEFLSCCDLVKFAKHHPPLEDLEEGLILVERLIQETKPSHDL